MAVPPRHVTIGDVWIDVSVREGHELQAEVTEHPVESGANVADHIRPLPAAISIEGIVTNHPIELPRSHAGTARASSASIEVEGEPSMGALSMVPGVDQGVALLGALKLDVRSKVAFAAMALHFTEPFDRVSAVHAALVSIVERRQLVTIVTGLMTYDNVALTSLSIERSGAVGRDKLEFSASGRVLRIVRSQTAKLPDPVDARGKPGKSRGKQPTAKVDPATLTDDNASALSKLPEVMAGVAANLKSVLGF
jgi:hypothetical protein